MMSNTLRAAFIALLLPAAAASAAGMDHSSHGDHAPQTMPASESHADHSDHAGTMDRYALENGDLAALNAKLAEARGITIEGVRLTADRTMIDYRYRIVDADKAARLHGQHIKPYIIDEARETKLEVPFASKVGSLRQSSKAPVQGRTYVILFANPGRWLKSGDTITIEQADLSISGITVE